MEGDELVPQFQLEDIYQNVSDIKADNNISDNENEESDDVSTIISQLQESLYGPTRGNNPQVPSRLIDKEAKLYSANDIMAMMNIAKLLASAVGSSVKDSNKQASENKKCCPSLKIKQLMGRY